MNSKAVVFTPLRIALITAIVISNLLALSAYLAKSQPWAEALGVFAVVFIMLFVFVILLEWVWLHHRAKAETDPSIQSKYKKAKYIYALLFFIGFAVGLLVLT